MSARMGLIYKNLVFCVLLINREHFTVFPLQVLIMMQIFALVRFIS
jgi:hypothetical protein